MNAPQASRSVPTSAAAPATPYAVEEVRTATGSRWQLTGPGLLQPKSYAEPEVREKLAELAQVMNFAWHQAIKTTR